MEFLKQMRIAAAFFLMCILCLSSCGSDSEYEEIPEYIWYPEQIEELPNGYLTLEQASAEGGEIMEYSFFETHVFVSDEEGIAIDSAPVYKGGMLVDYQGTYYVNGVRHDANLAKAKARSEELNREYVPGETVPLRRDMCRYCAVISDVRRDRFVFQLEKTEAGFVEYFPKAFLGSVETAAGKTVTGFTVESDGTVIVDLDTDDRIHKLVLTIPESGLTRVVLLQKAQ